MSHDSVTVCIKSCVIKEVVSENVDNILSRYVTGQPKCSQIFGMSLGNGGYWEAPDMCEYW